MNYRHAYHSGNHGDVLKHAVLARAVHLLKQKDKPFFVLDAHAGPAVHALDGPEALKTGEWREGVGHLQGRPLDTAAEAVLAPWRDCVDKLNPFGLTRYPGSAELVRQLLRPGDRLLANELHPEDHAILAAAMAHDRRVTVTAMDAGQAIKAHLPPPERRGLVLIDPAYERPDDAVRAVRMLRHGLDRFATGVFLLWYPVTGSGLSDRLLEQAAALGAPRLSVAELLVRRTLPQGGLAGSGLILVNPPWPLEDELPRFLKALAERLASDDSPGSGYRKL